MDGTSLDDILNGTEPEVEAVIETPEEQPAEAQAEAVETPAERPRDEHGRFLPKDDKPEPEGEPEVAAPSAPQDEPANIPVAALKDERSKRQTAEAERDELRRQLAQFQPQSAQPQPQAEGPPDRWEDPEGYDQWLIGQSVQAARGEAAQTFTQERIRMSAQTFKADKPDYDEKIQVFGQLAQQNPMLFEQMQQAVNPAEFAYKTATTQMELAQYGGLDGLIEARMAAEREKLLANPPAALPSEAPPTIAAERNVGTRGGPAWAGPQALEEILGR